MIILQTLNFGLLINFFLNKIFRGEGSNKNKSRILSEQIRFALKGGGALKDP